MDQSFTIKAIALAASCLLMSGSALAQAVAKYRVSVADLAVSDSLSAQSKKTVLESSLIANIENAIRNGRKFELLTRRADALAEIRKEQEFAKSGLAAGDAAHEGQLSNAQSVVKVTVSPSHSVAPHEKIPNIDGKYKVSDERLDYSECTDSRHDQGNCNRRIPHQGIASSRPVQQYATVSAVRPLHP